MSVPRWLRIVAVVAVVLVVVVVGATAAFVDLQVYRHAWRALVAGHDVYRPLPPTSVGLALPYIYPPFGLLAMAPVVALPWLMSAAVALLLSVGALVATLFAFLGARALVLVALPLALLAEPVRETLEFGQVNLWLMALVAVDCLLPKTRWPRGMLVGIAAAIKLTPAAFLLFFLVRRDFRAAGTAAATFAGFVVFGALVAPAASMRYWLTDLFHSGGMANSPFATNQSIPAELSRLGLSGDLLLCLPLAAGVLAAAVVVMRRVSAPVAVVVNAGAALLVAPISWSHHWVWAVPGLALLVTHAWRTGSRRAWYASGAGYLLVLVGPHQPLLPTGEGRELSWTPVQHLLGNNYLITAVVLLGCAVPCGRSAVGTWSWCGYDLSRRRTAEHRSSAPGGGGGLDRRRLLDLRGPALLRTVGEPGTPVTCGTAARTRTCRSGSSRSPRGPSPSRTTRCSPTCRTGRSA